MITPELRRYCENPFAFVSKLFLESFPFEEFRPAKNQETAGFKLSRKRYKILSHSYSVVYHLKKKRVIRVFRHLHKKKKNIGNGSFKTVITIEEINSKGKIINLLALAKFKPILMKKIDHLQIAAYAHRNLKNLPNVTSGTIIQSKRFDGRPRISVLGEVYHKDLYQLSNDCNPKVLNRLDILRIFQQVATGLEAIHKKGFAHFDIKMENILIKSKAGKSFYFAAISDKETCMDEKSLAYLQSRIIAIGTMKVWPKEVHQLKLDKHRLTTKEIIQLAQLGDVFSFAVLISETLGLPLEYSRDSRFVYPGQFVCETKVTRKFLSEYHSSFAKLLHSMLSDDYNMRPSMRVVKEILLKSEEKDLDFEVDLSAQEEKKSDSPQTPLRLLADRSISSVELRV